ncbi:hypothetical protein M5585_18840 [Serratia ureilytica]
MNQQTLDARRSRQALLAGSVGNFIEWYEFGVYGFRPPSSPPIFHAAG